MIYTCFLYYPPPGSHLHHPIPPARAAVLPSGAADSRRYLWCCCLWQRWRRWRRSYLYPLIQWNANVVASSLLRHHPCGTGNVIIPVASPLRHYCWRRQQHKSCCVTVGLPVLVRCLSIVTRCDTAWDIALSHASHAKLHLLHLSPRMLRTYDKKLERYDCQYFVTCVTCKIAFAASIAWNIAFVASTNAARIW